MAESKASAPPEQPYPPQGQPYPPQGQPYPPQGQPYPPQGQPYPPQGPTHMDPPPKYDDTAKQGLGAYPPQGYYGATTIVQAPNPQTTVIIAQIFGPRPCNITCPNCHAQVTSLTRYEAGGLTWLVAGLICLFGLWLFCCLIPFCLDDCKDVYHSCPNCKTTLGVYRRL